MNINPRRSSFIVAVGLSVAATAVEAAVTIDVAVNARQSTADQSQYVAKIGVTFNSSSVFDGITEVLYGGGFTVDCGSPQLGTYPPSAPTPLVRDQIYLNPTLFVRSPDTFIIGSHLLPNAIPDFELMPIGSVRTCKVIWTAAANFGQIGLNFSLAFNGASVSVSVSGGRIDLMKDGFANFTVEKGATTCPNPHPPNELAPAPGFDTPQVCDPLILDLGQNGLDLGPKGVGVYFDTNGDELSEYLQWVRRGGDEALLALDRNGNGIVDNGPELFGDGTRLTLENRNAPNGFVAIAQYDDPRLGGDDDGYITPRDAVWTELSIWLDSDADGISTLDEMGSLDDTGIVALPTIPRTRNYQDAAGNFIPYHATALTRSRPGKMEVVNVFFRGLRAPD